MLRAWLSLPLLAFTACAPDGAVRDHVEVLFGHEHPRVRGANALPTPPAIAALGKLLFAEPLAAGEARSCASCHQPSPVLEPQPPAAPLGEGVPPRQAPLLLDAARQFAFGWDGLEPKLEAMVARELVDPRRGGVADDTTLAATVAAAPRLAQAWQRAFDRAPRLADAAAAITGWLRTQQTTGAWDRYVDGDENALPPAARTGLATFVITGCAACHGGRILGGGSVHKLGTAQPYPTRDRGRAQVTQSAADEFLFRAPPLLHAATTGPWLHDGSVGELDDVVRLMARHELGRELPPADVTAIVAFLRAVAADRRVR